MPPAEIDAPTSDALRLAILALLETRAPGKTICPSEAARRVAPDGWRDLMDATRSVAAELASKGEVVVTQGGGAVNPATARGPIRLRLPD